MFSVGIDCAVADFSGGRRPASTHLSPHHTGKGVGELADLDLDQHRAIGLEGFGQRLGKAGLIRSASPSPDGRYVLVESYDRPFSYLVPPYRFPLSIGVWYRDGKVAFSLADLPLAEDVPIGRSATRTGPRSVSWRADAPATLAART